MHQTQCKLNISQQKKEKKARQMQRCSFNIWHLCISVRQEKSSLLREVTELVTQVKDRWVGSLGEAWALLSHIAPFSHVHNHETGVKVWQYGAAQNSNEMFFICFWRTSRYYGNKHAWSPITPKTLNPTRAGLCFCAYIVWIVVKWAKSFTLVKYGIKYIEMSLKH